MKIDGERLQQLIDQNLLFRAERGWKPVAEDVAKSISIEAAELLEHFQWDASQEKLSIPPEKDWEKIGAEVADVFIYLVAFCEEAGIDLIDALEKKLKHNEEKYPAAMFAGKHNHKAYLSQKEKYRK